MDMTTMKVNPLPAITWHWVHMNDSELQTALPDSAPDFSLSGQTQGMEWTIPTVSDSGQGHADQEETDSDDIHSCSFWDNTEAGMGDEFADFMQDTRAALLNIPEEYQSESAAVISVSPKKTCAAGQLFIYAGRGSDASVVISVHGGESDTVALQLKVFAQSGSKLRLYVAQTLPRKGICCLNVGGVCESQAHVSLTDLSLGAEKAYIGIAMKLEGDDSTFDGDMGYRVKPGQRVDINYVTRHFGKRSESHMNGWGVLEEGSWKLFRGTIDFHEGCPESVGAEKEDVLLLGEHQVNQTIPLILCHEENVEGDHGATISRLDDQVIFYLGSRGVDPETAEDMIAEARLEALCSRIPDETVRHEAEALIVSDRKSSVNLTCGTECEDNMI